MTTSLERLAGMLSATVTVKRDEPLSRHTTFGIGGPADLFATARDAEALKRATVRL